MLSSWPAPTQEEPESRPVTISAARYPLARAGIARGYLGTTPGNRHKGKQAWLTKMRAKRI